MRIKLVLLALLASLSGALRAGETTIYYGAHLTNFSPWCCRVTVYNMSAVSQPCRLKVYDAAGNLTTDNEYTVEGSLVVVFPTAGGFPPQPGEMGVPAVEGTFTLETGSSCLKPKIAYRYGNSQSLCEFLLPETMAFEYMLPNSVQDFFNWAGVAIMNPHQIPVDVRVSCHLKNGQQLAVSEVRIPGHSKYVRLAESIWPGVTFNQFDQIRIETSGNPVPPPMLIAGNNAQSRHIFFNAAVRPRSLYRDAVLGYLRRIEPGFFEQGSSSLEPCYESDEVIRPPRNSCPSPVFSCEYPMPHDLTRAYYIMETEVTRSMWKMVKERLPSLVDDPSGMDPNTFLNLPVHNLTWYEAILFANLASQMSGLYPCYYLDAGLTQPVHPGDYTTSTVYIDPLADGWRLPAEAEWEYACRAGTAGPFSVQVLYLNGVSCMSCDNPMPELMKVAVYCYNSDYSVDPVATKAPNPWGLYDMHGNVAEWCWDWYAPYPNHAETGYTGPAAPGAAVRKVSRGGSCRLAPNYLRSACRGNLPPGARDQDQGFRLVRTAMD